MDFKISYLIIKFANSNLNEFAAGVYEILDKLCNVLGIILEKEEEKKK